MLWMLATGVLVALIVLITVITLLRRSNRRESNKFDKRFGKILLAIDRGKLREAWLVDHLCLFEPQELISLGSNQDVAPEHWQRLGPALNEIGIVDLAVKQLRESKPPAKLAAVEFLAKVGLPRVVEPLLDALGMVWEDVRWAASDALKKLKHPGSVPLLIESLKQPLRWPPARVAEILFTLGTGVIPALAGALLDPDPKFRALVVEILGEFKQPAAVPTLLKAARDQEAEVRARAAAALGEAGDSMAVEYLCQLLQDANGQVRAQAARALGKLGNPSVILDLKLLSRDPEWTVRTVAAEAIKTLSGRLGLGTGSE